MRLLIRHIARWIKRYRWWLSGMVVALLVVYWHSLPDRLFENPTCTVIEDREGVLLGARIAADGQWRFPHNVEVPPKLAQAIVQFEDRDFYGHPGISAKAFGRALKQNVQAGRVVSGGSTITMQVVRLMRGNRPRTVLEKCLEVVLATRLELRYSKEEILAFWASNAPFGGNVVGLDAAAWRYFGRSADQLSWSESATLAVLPNAPSLIYPGKNQERLRAKRNRLLQRLHEVQLLDSISLHLAQMEALPEKPHA
ncbi:MAG: transglycosylase domain-containing protein, partial [Bacteroidota bacterium]